MSAKFEVNDLFLIKSRGHVIVGWIREGIIEAGMMVSIPSFPQKMIIQGIEMIITLNRSVELRGIVGLLFLLGSEQEDLLWGNLDIKRQILAIEDGNNIPLDTPTSPS